MINWIARVALKRVLETGIGLWHALVVEDPKYKARWIPRYLAVMPTFLVKPYKCDENS